jgi:hypothetical protein
MSKRADAGDSAFGVGRCAPRGIALGFAGKAAELSIELVDERGDEFRCHHPLPQAINDALRRFMPLNRPSRREGATARWTAESRPRVVAEQPS